MTLFDRPEWRLVVAAAIGLVMGAERERRKGEGAQRAAAGIRTFAVAALLGGAATHAGLSVVVLGGAFVAAAAIVAYAVGDRRDPGLTTEIALVLAYVLGVVAQAEPLVALGTAVAAAMLLALRAPLHRVMHSVLTTREILDALVFAVAAVVVLPLLPNRAVGPPPGVSPFVVWRLVVIVMGITGAGYVAQRALGPRYGLPAAGLASGFVSSAATIHAMGARARQDEAARSAAVAGATASTVATFVQLAILVGAASPPLLRHLAPSLALGGGAAVIYAGLHTWRAARAAAPAVRRGRAFRLSTALVFAAMVAVVTVASALLARLFGEAGLLVAAACSGFADAHAAAASIASVHATAGIATPAAAAGVLVALTTNTATKAIVAATGPRAYAARVDVGLALVLAAAWIGLALR